MARIARAPSVMDDISLFHEGKVAFGATKNKFGKNKTAIAASSYQFSEFD